MSTPSTIIFTRHGDERAKAPPPPPAERGVRVFANRLQPPSAIHQACVGQWTLGAPENSVEVVFGKSSYLSLHRFTPGAVAGHGERPSGALELIHEQPIFGVIKDIKTLRCRFEPETDNQMEDSSNVLLGEPTLGVVPSTATSDLLVCTSDSGVLSFIAYHNKPAETVPFISDYANPSTNTGRFVVVKEISIAAPGTDAHAYGAHIAIDPTSRIIATSSAQGHIKLLFLRPTKRSAFDPVKRETAVVVLTGTIIQMEFLAQDAEDMDDTIDLAVLFFDTDFCQHRIATIHINLDVATSGRPEFQVGQSPVSVDPGLATMHLKALPNYPRALVYVDEEKVTLVTIPKDCVKTHTHHPPLYLLKRDLSLGEGGGASTAAPSSESTGTLSKPPDEYPFISACAASPATPLTEEQVLYLGSHTAEIYRVNINTATNQMHFDMVSGERSVGKVMAVLARQSTLVEDGVDTAMIDDDDEEPSSTVYSTDYLLYSNDVGDGGLLAVQEDREGVNLFAVVEAIPNSSPLLDFCLREPSIPGGNCLYACSGMREEGRVLRIRTGIATEGSGSLSHPSLAGTVGLWGFARRDADEIDAFLVMSFVQSTKIMLNGEGESLEDISEQSGFNLMRATIFAGRLCDGVIFQVHREGVVIVWPDTGRSYTYESGEVVVAADVVAPGIIVLGTITEDHKSVLKFLRLQQGDQAGVLPSASLDVFSTISLREELTTICCWSNTPRADTDSQGNAVTRYCCIGTLEPSLVVFEIDDRRVREVYRESLAQDQREHVTIPQSLAIVEAPVDPTLNAGKRTFKLLVGLRDGTMLAYGWHPPTTNQPSSSTTTTTTTTTMAARMLSLPQLFKIGILPVKFVSSSSSGSSVLVLADRVWKAQMRSNRLEIDVVLLNGEVSHACSFRYAGPDSAESNGSQSSLSSSSSSCFAFLVNRQDLQLVTVGQHRAFNYDSLVSLGETPRRILDITSKKLMLVATVGSKFPADESRLRLLDTEALTASAADEGSDEQGDMAAAPYSIPEFQLRKGEMVCSMVEWRIPRANKADAVYICIGTAQFAKGSGGAGEKSSLGAPKSGRLVALSIKQNKKADRKDRRFEMELRWAMVMQAPVFAISPFLDKSLLVSVGSYLKLLALDLAKKTLVEKASYRERWPISHITSSEGYIFTGSRKESITMYEYVPSSGDHPAALLFLKSARRAKMISDCQALSNELVVASDMSGGVFGAGYMKDDSSCQHSLRDEFAFHVGEVISRIRVAKLWPRSSERSMRGLVLSQDHGGRQSQDLLSQSTCMDIMLPPITFQQMAAWTTMPWASSTLLPESARASDLSSDALPQALVACSHLGSVWGFWRLQPAVYPVLLRLQQTLQTWHHSRPVLGQGHDRFRSISGPMSNVIDGELVLQFLQLELALQLEAVRLSTGLWEYLQQWLDGLSLSTEERQVFDDYARALAAKYPLVGTHVLSRRSVMGNAAGDAFKSAGVHVDEEVREEPKLWWTFGVVHSLLDFMKVLHWHQ